MKVGIHASNRDQSPAELVQRCKDVGVDGVCLGCNVIDGFEGEGVPDTDHLNRVLDELRSAGVEVPSVLGARYSDAMFFGETDGEKERDALYRTVEVLAEAGVDSMLFWAIPSASEDATEKQEQLARVSSFYRKLGDHCATVGFNIASHPWVSRPGMFHGFETYTEMCKDIPTPNIGITFCPGGQLAGDNLPQVMDDFQNRIHFAHVRDQIGNWESFEEVFPGEGECEVAGLVRKLRDSGYTGLICPEHWGAGEPGEDREARAVAFIRDTLAT